MAEMGNRVVQALLASFCDVHIAGFHVPLETIEEFCLLCRSITPKEQAVLEGAFRWPWEDYRVTKHRWEEFYVWLAFGDGGRFLSTCEPWYLYAKEHIYSCRDCERAMEQPAGLSKVISADIGFGYRVNPYMNVIKIDRWPFVRLIPRDEQGGGAGVAGGRGAADEEGGAAGGQRGEAEQGGVAAGRRRDHEDVAESSSKRRKLNWSESDGSESDQSESESDE